MINFLKEAVGMTGSILFGFASIPMAIRSIREGNSGTIPTSSIWLFFSACIFFFSYLFVNFGFHVPFVIGIVETLSWLIVMKYRYFPRES